MLQVHSPATLTSSGLIALAGGTVFHLDRVTLATGSTFSGAGTLSMNGTTTVTGNLTVSLPITLYNTLTGSGAVHLAAPMTWIQGIVSLAGGLEVLTGRTLTLPDNNVARYVTNSSLLNHGTVAMGNSNAIIGDGTSTFTNAADGLWTSGTSYLSTSSGASTFSNAGILRQIGSAGTFVLAGNMVYTSTGTLNVQDGSLQVQSPATLVSSGLIDLAASTTFLLDRVTLAAGSSFAGAGTLNMNSTTTVTGDLTVALPITLSGNLTGSGAVHLAAPMTWASGIVSLAGGLEVLTGRTLTLPDNNVGRYVTNSSLLNHGTVAMGNSNGLLGDGTSTFTNAADGLWTSGSTYLSTSSGASPPSATPASSVRLAVQAASSLAATSPTPAPAPSMSRTGACS